MSAENVLLHWLERELAGQSHAPLVVGLCGAQGSGKSTLAAALARRIPGTAALSLDDLYLGRAQRRALADRVHPLLATRGVPGTHDVPLGIDTLAALIAGRRCRLPRFDKALDDIIPPNDWPVVAEPCRLIVFEGWCVGARAIPDRDMIDPANALERDDDADGRWRRYWNDQLQTRYPRLFAKIDRLVLLAAPAWGSVLAWRSEQEQDLRRSRGAGAGIMDDEALRRFVAHYERLTRHILTEMPSRADLTLRLADDRQLQA